MIEYKILSGPSGKKELEGKITALLQMGWKPVGGVAFNMGYAYQAMIGEMPSRKTPEKIEETPEQKQKLTFNEVLKLLE
jgi:hypothetical protein